MNDRSYSLMIHGGAGALRSVDNDRRAVRYLESLRVILEHGREVLELGGSALQAVEICVSLLEDDPLFNAGCGSVLNEDGHVEMDAAIMDGRDLASGAVASVTRIANPVQLARYLLSESPQVLLSGDGAMRFAEKVGMEFTPDSYFINPERLAQWQKASSRQQVTLDHDADVEGEKYGTVGAVARDRWGDLAAATSTGGMVNKPLGRIGDSALPGAGVYADNESCAVSATGVGEDFMRTALARHVADLVSLQGLDAHAGAARAIDYLRRRLDGQGGIIVIDRAGRCASAFTTPRMIHGWIEQGGPVQCRF